MIRKLAMTAVCAGLALSAPLAAQEEDVYIEDVLGKGGMAELRALEQRGLGLLQNGQIEEAEPLYREIVRINREAMGERSPYTIFAVLDYARVLTAAGRLDEADRAYVEGLTLARQVIGDRSPDTLDALSSYANLLMLRGELQSAADMYGVTLRLRREVLGDWDGTTITSMSNLADVLRLLGSAKEAEPLAEEALRRAEQLHGPDSPDRLESIFVYTGVLNALGRLEEAEPYYLLAIDITRNSPGEADGYLPRALSNYAVLLLDLYRAEEAEPYSAEALRVSRAFFGETHRTTVLARGNYAQVLQELQRKEEALPLLEQNLAVFRETLGERNPQTLLAMNNYAGGLIEVGRAEEALPIFERALEVRREVLGENHPDTIHSISTYATTLTYVGRDEEAVPLLAEVVRLRTEIQGPRHQDTLQALNNQGALLSKLDRLDEAEAAYRTALPIARDVLGERSIVALTISRSLSLILLDTDRPAPALELAREVTGELRARGARQATSGVGADAQRTREASGQRINEGLFADALWANHQVADPQLSLQREAFTALQLASAGSASQAVTEAAAARFATGQGLREVVEERQQRVAQWSETDAALLEAVAGGAEMADQRAELRERLDLIEQRLGELDARLAESAPQYFAILRQQAVEIDALREVLDEDEAILFLVSSRLGTHSMVVTREGIDWQLAELDAKAVAAEVEELREGLEIRAGDVFLPTFDLGLAHSLYSDLIAPVESALTGKARVYVVADGALSRLPLGTLITAARDADADPDDPETLRNAPWLADRYALVQIPSVQSLVYIRQFHTASGEPSKGQLAYAGFGAPVLGGAARTRGARSATLDALDAASLIGEVRAGGKFALMNPEALRKLSSLPGTKDELQKVAGAFGGGSSKLWLDTEMTETAIRDADLSRTRILHLATHGFTSEEAGSLAEPGLVFTPPAEAGPQDDGYLAASEVVALDLDAARWVILSACNTASPSGKPGATGLSGLAQAFFYAGAESLLVSHWPVFDDIAPRLTTETLRRSEEGMPRAEALQAAMREIRMNREIDASHPAVWAPFVLVGEGR